MTESIRFPDLFEPCICDKYTYRVYGELSLSQKGHLVQTALHTLQRSEFRKQTNMSTFVRDGRVYI